MTLGIKRALTLLFIPQSPTQTETFKAAVKRLGLSEQDLVIKQQGLMRLVVLMLVLALGLLGYTVYQGIYGSILGVVVSLVLTLIALVMAFRYHFWWFQIKHRKLGCSLREWFHRGVLGEKT